MTSPQIDQKPEKPWWRTPSGLAAVLTAVAAVTGTIVTLRNNIADLIGWQATKITLRDATSTVANPVPSDIPISFVVVVNRGTKEIECTGEGSAIDTATDSYSILSSSGARISRVSIAEGEQAKLINLQAPPNAGTLNLSVLNFRLDCAGFGKTAYARVNVTVSKQVASAEPQSQPPPTPLPTPLPNPKPEPIHPTQSFKVCSGNGGGPSCQSGAAAYYTCDQYSSIGGGSQRTYDVLARKFCEYSDAGTTKLRPNKVIVNSSVSGGQCGWTTFTVICNP